MSIKAITGARIIAIHPQDGDQLQTAISKAIARIEDEIDRGGDAKSLSIERGCLHSLAIALGKT